MPHRIAAVLMPWWALSKDWRKPIMSKIVQVIAALKLPPEIALWWDTGSSISQHQIQYLWRMGLSQCRRHAGVFARNVPEMVGQRCVNLQSRASGKGMLRALSGTIKRAMNEVCVGFPIRLHSAQWCIAYTTSQISCSAENMLCSYAAHRSQLLMMLKSSRIYRYNRTKSTLPAAHLRGFISGWHYLKLSFRLIQQVYKNYMCDVKVSNNKLYHRAITIIQVRERYFIDCFIKSGLFKAFDDAILE